MQGWASDGLSGLEEWTNDAYRQTERKNGHSAGEMNVDMLCRITHAKITYITVNKVMVMLTH